MPSSTDRPPRRPKRLRAVALACVVLGTAALAAPSSAGAYAEHFCQYAYMPSGSNCFASNIHTLQSVNGWTINSFQRICAATFTTQWGGQTSDWRCDYQFVQKWLGGRVVGVGGLHNGDPWAFFGYGTQDF